MSRSNHQGFFRLFEQQALVAPGRVAVLCDGQALPYGELDKAANRLAHRLKRLGAGPETLVGLCTDRSIAMVVGLLGILKSGAAYVPLDPAYPRERLESMLAQADVRLILSQTPLAGLIGGEGRRTVMLDHWDDLAAEPCEPVDHGPCERNVAYLIYTSGSTGRPKGVAIEHRSTFSLLRWGCRTFGAQRLARVLATSSLCFDMSVFEIFAPLSCGGTVVLAPSIMALSGIAEAESLTLVSAVPSAIKELVHDGDIPPTLKDVLLAGEALTEPLVSAILEHTAVDRIWNLYGVSEDTSYTTSAEIGRGHRGPVPIGRPIDDRDLHILDPSLDPVPAGAVGELYIGGLGLARGYHGRADLTADRFLPHPASACPGERMYRTGDLVRQWPDGQLECLGRIDNQIKLRGHRIDPRDIECVLESVPNVRACAVVVQEDDEGERHLVAHVVADDPAPDPAALRRLAGESLPHWMVPAIVRLTVAIPLTSNGKVDRRQLGQSLGPSGGRPEEGEGFFQVVANRDRQFALWPANRPLPPGWSPAGPAGPRSTCLEFIGQTLSTIPPTR